MEKYPMLGIDVGPGRNLWKLLLEELRGFIHAHPDFYVTPHKFPAHIYLPES
jgi:hypothetical protein